MFLKGNIFLFIRYLDVWNGFKLTTHSTRHANRSFGQLNDIFWRFEGSVFRFARWWVRIVRLFSWNSLPSITRLCFFHNWHQFMNTRFWFFVFWGLFKKTKAFQNLVISEKEEIFWQLTSIYEYEILIFRILRAFQNLVISEKQK